MPIGHASPWRRRLALAVLAVFVLPGGPADQRGSREDGLQFSLIASALADDDDDDDDDGGSSGGGHGFGGRSFGEGGSARPRQAGPVPRVMRQPLRSLRSIFGGSQPRRTVRQRRAPAPVAAPLAQRAEREIAALGLDDDQIVQLESSGYGVLERAEIGLLDAALVRLALPDGLSLEEARLAIGALNPASVVDFNHYYRPESDRCDGPHCAAPAMIAWPVEGDVGRLCGRAAPIGLIDTGINADHETFAEGALRLVGRFGPGAEPSDRKHGTAVAALLVGSKASRSPGLLPGAALLAVDAFVSAGDDTRADVFNLVRGLDRLVGEGASVVNMSLAGPANTVLERSVAVATDGGTLLVAAAGNAGPRAAPLYPAAFDEVIAVTAVDARGRPYRRAAQGAHVDVAAPGVEVWAAASISGARPKSGTSFAAPFVTAAAALFKQRAPDANVEDFRRYLEATAEDLGEKGRDDVFGYGLLKVGDLCKPRIAGLWEPEEVHALPGYLPVAAPAPPTPATADDEVR